MIVTKIHYGIIRAYNPFIELNTIMAMGQPSESACSQLYHECVEEVHADPYKALEMDNINENMVKIFGKEFWNNVRAKAKEIGGHE